MLTDLWVILLVVAILLIIIIAVFEYDEYPVYWCIMLSLLDIILWFILAASVAEWEEPWTMFNATSGNVEYGMNIVSSKICPELTYFCMMMAGVMTLYSAYAVLMTFRELYSPRTGEPEHPYDHD